VQKTNNCPHFFFAILIFSVKSIFLSKYIVLYALSQPIDYMTFKFTFYPLISEKFSLFDADFKILTDFPAIFVIVYVIGKKKVSAIICLLLQPMMNSTLVGKTDGIRIFQELILYFLSEKEPTWLIQFSLFIIHFSLQPTSFRTALGC